MSSHQFDASFSNMDAGGHISSHNVGYVEVNGSGNSITFQPRPLSVPTSPPLNSLSPLPIRRIPAPRCPPASQNFIGRVHELEQIWAFFFGPGALSLGLRVFLLIGMGGCGKTQLARKFMGRVYRSFKDKHQLVFYLDATTRSTLEASLCAIAIANGVGDSSEGALAWMSTLDTECFLYIDNADDHTIDLREYFPKSEYARILVTTRLRDAQQNYGSGLDSVIHLGALGEEEAVELLLRIAGVERDEEEEGEEVGVLVQELQSLALAIVQAGAAISKSKWSIHEYLQEFRKLRTSLMDGKNDRVEAKAIDGYPLHVYTTWRLSYDKLSESTASLLRLFAHLHHTGLTEDLFSLAYQGLADDDLCAPPVPFTQEEPAARAFVESFATDGGIWESTKFRWCIQEACSFSLLSYDPANHVYSVHPLVHDCLRSIAPHPSQAAFILAATIQPLWSEMALLTALVPHVQQVLRCWGEWRDEIHPEVARCLGQCFYLAGVWSDGRALQEAAFQRLAAHSTANSDAAGSFGNLSDALALCDGDSEDQIYKDTKIIRMLASLALTLQGLGRYSEAERMERRVLGTTRMILGPNHPETIIALGNLAATLYYLGRYEEAEITGREVLEKAQLVLGVNHPKTIAALANLASTLWKMGRYAASEEMDREVLERSRATLGPDHPDTLIAMADLALSLHDLGRFPEAEVMERRVLVKRRAILGFNHTDTIVALANLASTLHRLGRYAEAEGMQREVVEKIRLLLGRDHPHLFKAYANLAATLVDQDRCEEAEEMQRGALSGRVRVLGPEHPDTLIIQAQHEATLVKLKLRQRELEESTISHEEDVSGTSPVEPQASAVIVSVKPTRLTSTRFMSTSIAFSSSEGAGLSVTRFNIGSKPHAAALQSLPALSPAAAHLAKPPCLPISDRRRMSSDSRPPPSTSITQQSPPPNRCGTRPARRESMSPKCRARPSNPNVSPRPGPSSVTPATFVPSSTRQSPNPGKLSLGRTKSSPENGAIVPAPIVNSRSRSDTSTGSGGTGSLRPPFR